MGRAIMNRRVRRSATGNSTSQRAIRPRRLVIEALEDRRVLSTIAGNDPIPFPTPLTPVAPLGSLIYEGTATDQIAAADETDYFTIDLDGSQSLALLVEPSADLKPVIEVTLPWGFHASASAAGPGRTALIQPYGLGLVGTGTCTVAVHGAEGTTGTYNLRLILNAAVEDESLGYYPNDTPATAQWLDPSMFAVESPGYAERGGVLGSLSADTFSEDWYQFTLYDSNLRTFALTANPADSVKLELYDFEGHLLASGVAEGNGSQVIHNFSLPSHSADQHIFLVRVSGTGGDYSLVALRNADLDVETDGTPARINPQVPFVLSHTAIVPTISPEQQGLQSSDIALPDGFGSSVAVSGNWAIVGAPGDEDRGIMSGSTYIFQRTDAGWVEVAKLLPTTLTAYDYFGGSVAISGNTAVVGACGDDTFGPVSGSAYVFQYTETGWTQVARLKAEDASRLASFGNSVSIENDTILIGAPFDKGVESGTGAAYVFQNRGNGWTQVAKLMAPDGKADERFGGSTALSNGTVLVGAVYNDECGTNAGAAYVYEETGSGWQMVAQLLPDGARGNFGNSVALSGGTALVGAFHEGGSRGTAYVFKKTSAGWIRTAKIDQPEPENGHYFGQQVSLSGGTAIISGCPTISVPEPATAFVFQDTGTEWRRIADLSRSDYGSNGSGLTLSINGSDIFVRNNVHSSSGTGAVDAYSLEWASDRYVVSAKAGDPLQISVHVPASGPGQFDNRLVPIVELYDPSGALVAQAQGSVEGGPDVALTHTTLLSGDYTVRVTPAQNRGGEYLLRVEGASGSQPAFQASSPDLQDGATVLCAPSSITLDFNQAILLTSLEPADFLIDGLAATGMTIVDGDTVRFDLPQLSGVTHHVTIAAGALQSVSGVANEAFSLEFRTLTDLGVVEYQERTSVKLGQAGESWYSCQPVRAGFLTLVGVRTGTIAGSGPIDEGLKNVQLALYDSNFTLLAQSTVVADLPRLDFEVPSAGQTYYLKVVSPGTPGYLGVANLVQRVGNQVKVFGTRGDDQFIFYAISQPPFFPAGRRITINRVDYMLDPAVTAVTFDGREGSNSAGLAGSEENEIFVARPGSATLLGSTYSVNVVNARSVTASGQGGQDLARLYGSSADDHFRASPAAAAPPDLYIPADAMLSADDGSYSYWAVDFDFVQAYSGGGNDTAEFYDSAGKDAFTYDPGNRYADISGDGFYFRANAFRSVVAHSRAGDDIARFYDSPGDDQFESFPSYATMTGGGFTGRAENFRYFLGYSTSGNDKATLHDSPQAETYVGAPTWGILFNPSSCYSRVTNFKTTEVFATPGADDLARLYDGPGDDQLVAYPGDVTFAGPGLSQHVLGFRFVQAYAVAGGVDQAHFYDSAGQDTFEAHRGTASMQSADYLNRASNFAAYRAYSLLGGGDVAKFYDTPGDDTFDGYLAYATLSGLNYSARADGFANVLAYATAGGTDTANFHGTAGAESFLGMSGTSRLSNSTYSQMASAFDKVYFLSGGGSDTITLYDSTGADHLEAGSDWAQFVSPGQVLYLSALSDSSTVKAYGFNGGKNTKRVAATDYALETLGPWDTLGYWLDESP